MDPAEAQRGTAVCPNLPSKLILKKAQDSAQGRNLGHSCCPLGCIFLPLQLLWATSCPHTLATGLPVRARGGPRWDSWWAAGGRVSSFREWALNICSPPPAAGSFLSASDFWDFKNRTGGGQDPEQSLPHSGLLLHRIDPFLLRPPPSALTGVP